MAAFRFALAVCVLACSAALLACHDGDDEPCLATDAGQYTCGPAPPQAVVRSDAEYDSVFAACDSGFLPPRPGAGQMLVVVPDWCAECQDLRCVREENGEIVVVTHRGPDLLCALPPITGMWALAPLLPGPDRFEDRRVGCR